jgi:hypothetical protein
MHHHSPLSIVLSLVYKTISKSRFFISFSLALLVWVFTRYARQAEVPFCINLYVDPKSAAPRTVIEFQRMGGDGWAFLDVARAARYFLESTDLVEGGVAVADGARKALVEFKPASSAEAPVRDLKAVEDAVCNVLNVRLIPGMLSLHFFQMLPIPLFF